MAFVILDNGQFYKISKTEADKNDINVSARTKSEVTITEAEFNSFVTNQKDIIVNNGAVSFIDKFSSTVQNEAALKEKFDNFKKEAKLYISKNQGKQLATQLQTYLGVLSQVDTSSLTYPINWEQHCVDNSITFLHEYQIG